MAMKPCKECGKEISTTAKVCPHCGKKHPTGGLTLPAKIFLGFILLAAFGKLIGGNDNSKKLNVPAGNPYTSTESPKEKAMRSVTVDFKWHKGGFGNVMIADFKIINPTEYRIKDIELTCTHYAKSGTRIDSNTRTIYDVVPAKSKKVFKDFNMGIIHSQAASSAVEVTDLQIIK